MNIQISSISDIGKVRTDNEDCLIISEESRLYCVSDGMGGLAYGKVTAEIVREQMLAYFHLLNENNIEITSEKINDIIKKISQHISMMGNVFGGETLYGATLTGLAFSEDKAYVFNVGDSRVYRCNTNGLTQLTKDQNLITHMIDTGKIDKLKAKTHSLRNVVLEFMGKPPFVKPDVFEIEINNHDIYCICSDGLFSMVDEQEIQDILMSDLTLDDKCQQLVDKANAAGGKDNISVILLELRKD